MRSLWNFMQQTPVTVLIPLLLVILIAWFNNWLPLGNWWLLILAVWYIVAFVRCFYVFEQEVLYGDW